MKTLKRMIILIMVFIIIILLVVLGLLNKYGKKEESDKDSYENGADQVNINTELNEVTEPTYYYTVYSCLENYIKSVTTKLEEFDAENYIPGGEMNYFEMLGIQTENEKNQYIYNLLDSNYIRENNITINNINQYVESNKLNINFNIEKICTYDDKKVEELLKNEKIIRNRLKIKATINNAKIFKNIQKECGSFHEYIENFSKGQIFFEIDKTTSKLSDEISKDLQKRGMKFVGSTIIYSYLQAIGIIYSHDKECYKYENKESFYEK